MYILRKAWNEEWDNGLTLKLFVKFLKKHHCLQNFYGYIHRNGDDFLDGGFLYPPMSHIPDMFMSYGKNYKGCIANGFISIKKDLILSQLWRFYVLGRIDKYPERSKEKIKEFLIGRIEYNGVRDNKKLKRLFNEYNIKITT